LFLLAKSTYEIHQKLEGDVGEASARVYPSFASVIVQILLLDVVFSLDSVITAVGMVNQLAVMVTAVTLAVGFMLVFASPISGFVERHPTVKMLALSFLLLIGVTLIAEGLDQHIPKGYIYFAMAFSVFVECLNLRLQKPKAPPVQLHEPYVQPGAS
jgi:predicted tellurium resistance membrane protein TerC